MATAKKILIAYYTRSSNTENLAKAIQSKVGGDIVEIQTDHKYPSDYHSCTEVAKKEIRDGFLPNILNKIDNIAEYDAVFVGTPVWWGHPAPAVVAFVKTLNLAGKKVIPFVTHGGGGADQCYNDINKAATGATPLQGAQFYESSQDKLEGWLQKVIAQI